MKGPKKMEREIDSRAKANNIDAYFDRSLVLPDIGKVK